MRAEFVENLQNFKDEDSHFLSTKEYHHLINVARVKVGDELLLLDGQGLSVESEIINIDKKSIELGLKKTTTHKKNFHIDIAICLNKKDPMDLLLKQAVELGVNKILPISSEYSQKSFVQNDRSQRLLVSALKQSNNAFLPELVEQTTFSELSATVYDHIFAFSMKQHKPKNEKLSPNSKILIIIGPEGGLSEQEEEQISAWGNSESIHFPTPILRATTALPTAFGWVLTQYG